MKYWYTIYTYILQNISQVIFLSLFCLVNRRQFYWLCIASRTHFYNSDQILFSYKTFLLHSDVFYTFITFSLFWASNDCSLWTWRQLQFLFSLPLLSCSSLFPMQVTEYVLRSQGLPVNFPCCRHLHRHLGKLWVFPKAFPTYHNCLPHSSIQDFPQINTLSFVLY